MIETNGYSKTKELTHESRGIAKSLYLLDWDKGWREKWAITHAKTQGETPHFTQCFSTLTNASFTSISLSHCQKSLFSSETSFLWWLIHEKKDFPQMIRPFFSPSSVALPQTFISGCRRLGTRSRWCACSRAVCWWGPSTAGSLTSSRPKAPGSIGTRAPPAGGRATRRRWEPTWRGGRERGGISPGTACEINQSINEKS